MPTRKVPESPIMSSQFNDADDDLPLHPRTPSREIYQGNETQAANMADSRLPEREVTLNTGIVLALFFALALLCAVFFGFGYSIGHKSGLATAAALDQPDPAPVAENTASAAVTKPSPGVAATQPVPGYVPSAGPERTVVKALPAPPLPPMNTSPAPTKPAPIVRVPPPSAATVIPPVAATAVPSGPGTFHVQIAAVSHQEDADVLLSALRRRGYTVLTRSDPADKLIHVQVGPFGNRKEADEMRKKLAGDGYNAFIK
ncbi:MAG: SPOR domain-containing protein [Janthinobacterium lividum]